MSDVAPSQRPLVPGVASALSPLVRRILAPNPGFFTGPGTNTYVVGIDEAVVIDPGPVDDDHLEAILGCGGDRIRWIVLTHTHSDHAPGAVPLKERTGAEVLAFEPRDDVELDGTLADRGVIEATEFRLRAIHTPGHTANHLCFYLEEERMLFSGDHIMEGSTVVIDPPDGDMRAYLASLEKVRKLRLRSIAPGHGQLVPEPLPLIDEYIRHRLERERQIVDVLDRLGPATIDQLVPEVYAELAEELVPLAGRQAFAHLRKLFDDGQVTAKDVDDPATKWQAA
jgi:glyoxylase-like metal-dependent hydrolase (beta-lactamase superfamily II)